MYKANLAVEKINAQASDAILKSEVSKGIEYLENNDMKIVVKQKQDPKEEEQEEKKQEKNETI